MFLCFSQQASVYGLWALWLCHTQPEIIQSETEKNIWICESIWQAKHLLLYSIQDDAYNFVIIALNCPPEL